MPLARWKQCGDKGAERNGLVRAATQNMEHVRESCGIAAHEAVGERGARQNQRTRGGASVYVYVRKHSYINENNVEGGSVVRWPSESKLRDKGEKAQMRGLKGRDASSIFSHEIRSLHHEKHGSCA